jgi:hypothetical protein
MVIAYENKCYSVPKVLDNVYGIWHNGFKVVNNKGETHDYIRIHEG